MKMNQKTKAGFTLVELLVVIVIIAALAGLTAPMVIRQRKKADQTEAVSNARQIGIALLEFETEYGSFPDASTAETVQTNTETTLTLTGTNANDYFRQMVAAEIAQSEQMFYAKTAFSKKPDGILTGTKALEDGEVGYGYLLNGQNAFSTAGNPGRPIIAAPLEFTGNSVSATTFDPDYYDSKAVILKVDNSVTSINILKATKVAQLNGKNILTTGDDSVWGSSVTPTFAVPTVK